MIQLQVETIAVCNAACVFCPYPTMSRKKGRMDAGLYSKLIHEAAEIIPISEVSFQGLGEPLLDRDIVERIYLAKAVRQGWTTTMYTNGSKLTMDLVKVLERAGLGTLYVSLNASSPAQRRDIMKLDDYDQVVAVVREALAFCTTMRVVPKGVVGMDFFSGEDVELFKQVWGHDRAFLHLEGNWAGQTWDVRVKSSRACSRALGQIMVLWDGRVSLCCFDGEGEVIFGDLNHQHIKDVYNSDEYVRYRLAHAEGNRASLKLCDNCTAI